MSQQNMKEKLEKYLSRLEQLAPGKVEFDNIAKELDRFLFEQLCPVDYKETCEPEYCSLRIEEKCPYLQERNRISKYFKDKGLPSPF